MATGPFRSRPNADDPGAPLRTEHGAIRESPARASRNSARNRQWINVRANTRPAGPKAPPSQSRVLSFSTGDNITAGLDQCTKSTTVFALEQYAGLDVGCQSFYSQLTNFC